MSNKKQMEKDAFVFPACPTKPRVPSDREVDALDAMRAIKERARVLKDRLQALTNEPGGKGTAEIAGVESELKEMRTEWDSWEKKRLVAARERMILLGHEEGGSEDG